MNFKIIECFFMSVLASQFPNVKEIASMYNKLEEESLKVSPRTYSKKYSSFIQTTEADVSSPSNQEERKSELKSIYEKAEANLPLFLAENDNANKLYEAEDPDTPLKLNEEGINFHKLADLTFKDLLNADQGNVSDVSTLSDQAQASISLDEESNTLPANSSFIFKYFPEAYDSSLSNANTHAVTSSQKNLNELLTTENDSFDKKIGKISSLNE